MYNNPAALDLVNNKTTTCFETTPIEYLKRIRVFSEKAFSASMSQIAAVLRRQHCPQNKRF